LPLIFKKEISEASDSQAKWLEKEKQYSDLFANPYRAAERGFVDEVIEPSETRNKLIKAFNTKVHLLQISKDTSDANKVTVFSKMDEFASANSISNFDKHVLNDTDVENGVIHFNQMQEMDIICIGTHGKGGLFHQSATEKLINHLFKPIISYHLKN
jgi:nucleotide-binding universal stress UspA family protein